MSEEDQDLRVAGELDCPLSCAAMVKILARDSDKLKAAALPSSGVPSVDPESTISTRSGGRHASNAGANRGQSEAALSVGTMTK
jgi:hypothetical protein